MGIFFTDPMKTSAKTVMKVTFKDRNRVTFFGLGKTRQGAISQNLEIIRHKRNVAQRANAILEATIYKNRYPAKDGGIEDTLMTYKNGVWINYQT